jgi:HlyD family secretion protein
LQPKAAANYNVRLSVPPEEADKVGAVRLMGGMQMDVFIKTSDRMPLEYLLQPVNDQFARVFRGP